MIQFQKALAGLAFVGIVGGAAKSATALPLGPETSPTDALVHLKQLVMGKNPGSTFEGSLVPSGLPEDGLSTQGFDADPTIADVLAWVKQEAHGDDIKDLLKDLKSSIKGINDAKKYDGDEDPTLLTEADFALSGGYTAKIRARDYKNIRGLIQMIALVAYVNGKMTVEDLAKVDPDLRMKAYAIQAEKAVKPIPATEPAPTTAPKVAPRVAPTEPATPAANDNTPADDASSQAPIDGAAAVHNSAAQTPTHFPWMAILVGLGVIAGSFGAVFGIKAAVGSNRRKNAIAKRLVTGDGSGKTAFEMDRDARRAEIRRLQNLQGKERLGPKDLRNKIRVVQAGGKTYLEHCVQAAEKTGDDNAKRSSRLRLESHNPNSTLDPANYTLGQLNGLVARAEKLKPKAGLAATQTAATTGKSTNPEQLMSFTFYEKDRRPVTRELSLISISSYLNEELSDRNLPKNERDLELHLNDLEKLVIDAKRYWEPQVLIDCDTYKFTQAAARLANILSKRAERTQAIDLRTDDPNDPVTLTLNVQGQPKEVKKTLGQCAAELKSWLSDATISTKVNLKSYLADVKSLVDKMEAHWQQKTLDRNLDFCDQRDRLRGLMSGAIQPAKPAASPAKPAAAQAPVVAAPSSNQIDDPNLEGEIDFVGHTDVSGQHSINLYELVKDLMNDKQSKDTMESLITQAKAIWSAQAIETHDNHPDTTRKFSDLVERFPPAPAPTPKPALPRKNDLD